MKIENEKTTVVDEPKIEFNLITDKICLSVVNDDIDETLVEISGYDLQINFNLKYIKSIEDVELAVTGIGDMFRKTSMDQLLEDRKQND